MEKLVLEKYNRWLNEKRLSKEEKEELLSIANNEKEVTERFIADLEFGTAGLRGVMAMGTNRMNKYVIRHASQGLAQYLLSEEAKPSVAIAYDSRNNSELFAKEAASTLAANGIKVHIFKRLMPVPTLSFAVRHLHCSAGVVITASHNPKIYNGFKVYGSDGCQMTIDAANKVLANINKLEMFDDVKYIDFEKGIEAGEIKYISDELVEEYYASVLSQSVKSEKVSPRILNITYTPLHGAGYIPVTTVLERDGFKHIDIVEEQRLPDGNFTTCPYPNPEILEAMDLGMKLMLKNNNDILVATDPDSDRAGVAVNQNGKAIILTGNEIGILLFDFIYTARKEEGKLPNKPVVVKSIVSSDLVDLMGKEYGVEIRNVLTGFKFIGEQILFLEQKGEEDRFIFGFEESYGYLTNHDVRDKDGVNAMLLIAEMANYYKHKGLTLLDRLNQLYDKFGHYKTVTLSFEFPGLDGKDKMQSLMKHFREESFKKEIGTVEKVGDYKLAKIFYSDHEEDTGLPKSDVIKFFLKDHETVIFRPSGTEPKLKAYVFANGDERIAHFKKLITSFMK